MNCESVITGSARRGVACSDALAWLRGLPDGIARTCVTSPPYFGLRDYGTASWEGGDQGCDHASPNDAPNGNKGQPTTHAGRNVGDCRKCGARRVDGQIGLERTPDEFVARLVDVFREVRRVLSDDGTLWLNLGDSYNAYNGNRGRSTSFQSATEEAMPSLPQGNGLTVNGLSNKQLIGIPWRVAFALQANGWYLRQDIIWHKPNPMPESVKDRCTKSHEYIFLLAKSERYYFDAEAIQEKAAYAGQQRGGSTSRYEQNNAGMDCKEYDTRNKRSVWSVNPKPYKGAHFATFPPDLIEPCILAGSAEGDIVLEPFAGSGTTLAVAVGHGRRAIGSELNPKYVKLIERRMQGVTPPLLACG